MFLPRFQSTLTPAQFATLMCHKTTEEQLVLLALQDGNVFVMADEELPHSLMQHCTNIPLTVAPNNFTTEQFTAFMKASAAFYQWAYYLDEEEFQRHAIEGILQRVDPNTMLPFAMCINNVQTRRTVKQPA